MPRIMGRTVQVPAAVTAVAVLIGAALLGIVGALVAIPVAAASPAAAARDDHPAAGQELSEVSGDAYLIHGLAPVPGESTPASPPDARRRPRLSRPPRAGAATGPSEAWHRPGPPYKLCGRVEKQVQ